MAIKFFNNIEVDGEVQGTSLDINGTADISGDLGVAGALYQTESGTDSGIGVFMPMVQGGMKVTNSSQTTGRLRIKVPTYKSLAMQTFYIDVYEYNTDRSQTYRVSGYNYNDTNATWYNTSVVALFDSDNRDLTVRFGADTSASEQYVSIGETSTTWTYVQVVVRDYIGGYSTAVSEATAAFRVEFVTTDNASYSANHDNNQPYANWSKIEGIPSTFTPNTSITDSISTTSSTTRASATAAKAAYDRGSTGVTNAASAQTTANAALPKAGGTMSGAIAMGSNNITGGGTIGAANFVGTSNYHEFGNATGSVSNDGTWNGRLNVAGTSHARLDVKSVSDGIITSMYAHTGNAAGRMGTMSNHPVNFIVNGNVKATLDSSSNFAVTGELEGGSLDINGNADISGNLTGVDTLTATTLSVTNYGLASADIPNNAANTSGNAATATMADQATNLNAIDDRDMAPEDRSYSDDFRIFFTSKEGLEDGTSTGSNWQDALFISSYSDSSGGNPNVLAFDKSEKKIYHYQASATASNWGTAKQLAYTDSDISGNAATASTASSAAKLTDGGGISTHPGTSNLIYTGALGASVTGLFAASDNSNSIITVNRHSGDYNSQLGFSSNGNLYYRKFSGSTAYTTQGWKTLAFTDSDISGDTTGNAATATTLATARNIGGVSFNGSAAINLPGVNTSGNQNTSGNAATATTATNVTASSVSNAADYFGCFVSSTGTQGIKVANGLKYNPSTNVLTAGKISSDTVSIVENAKSGSACMTITGAGSGTEANIALKIQGTSHGDPVKLKMKGEDAEGGEVGKGLLSFDPASDTFSIGQSSSHNSMAIKIDNSDIAIFKNMAQFPAGIDITGTTDATDATGDTGMLRCEGGASIAKKLYVGSTITGSADVIAYSDERLKKNVKTLDGKKVLEMRGVSFERTDSGKQSSGVIAQELEKVAPELVIDDGSYKGVAYGNVVGYLIEAIKDQQKQIDELKAMCNGCSK